ncbi:MAG: UbiX family flavin prenyltransferase [Fibrobacter sp.]|nr:UbiX family flavin prenyltransferase [Fibrobacter sp.]
MKNKVPWIIGVTGASGAIYATRLLRHLQKTQIDTHLLLSDAGAQVLEHEKQTRIMDLATKSFAKDDWFAPPASGSADYAGMVIIPCSMGTLAKIAHGIADNLLTRAASVCLKENRPLIVVPRETPMGKIHLENMLKLSEAGAGVIPACPHFYQNPTTVEQVVDTVVAKVLQQMKIPQNLVKPWGKS